MRTQRRGGAAIGIALLASAWVVSADEREGVPADPGFDAQAAQARQRLAAETARVDAAIQRANEELTRARAAADRAAATATRARPNR